MLQNQTPRLASFKNLYDAFWPSGQRCQKYVYILKVTPGSSPVKKNSFTVRPYFFVFTIWLHAIRCYIIQPISNEHWLPKMPFWPIERTFRKCPNKMGVTALAEPWGRGGLRCFEVTSDGCLTPLEWLRLLHNASRCALWRPRSFRVASLPVQWAKVYHMAL